MRFIRLRVGVTCRECPRRLEYKCLVFNKDITFLDKVFEECLDMTMRSMIKHPKKDAQGKDIYVTPDMNPIHKLVIIYKVMKGFQVEDKLWDKRWFGRAAKSAKSLYEICGNDFQKSVTCMNDIKKHFDTLGFSWTFETMADYSLEWIQKGKLGDKGRDDGN